MQVLVTLCNKSENPNLREPHGFLYRVDLGDHSTRLVDLGFKDAEGAHGATGLARNGDGIIVIIQRTLLQLFSGEPIKLLLLNRALEVQQAIPLRLVRDPHSLASQDGVIYVVSAGKDSIICVSQTGEETLFLNITGARRDTIHLNSLAFLDDHLLYTAFGHKAGETHHSARDGYIFDCALQKRIVEGVFQPHSLTLHGGKVFFCESGSGRVHCSDGSFLDVGEGYLRGLIVTAEVVIVGISRQRKKSKSTGKEVYTPHPEKEGRCELRIFRKGRDLFHAEPIDRICLEEIGDEIYDILV